MKTKQEIEQLAEKYMNRFIVDQPFIKDMFIEVYTQCQKDMDKKYTEEDMFKVWLRCRVNSDEEQVSYELFKNFINSLNKQD